MPRFDGPPRVLCVAEKPSVCRGVSEILNNGRMPPSRRGFLSPIMMLYLLDSVLVPALSEVQITHDRCLTMFVGVCALVRVSFDSSQYNHIYEFPCLIRGTQCDVKFTSVAGHLMGVDFDAQHRKWYSCSPIELFSAPISKEVPDVRCPI
eukprot:926345-Prorocentrum_minimum.AAC.4